MFFVQELKINNLNWAEILTMEEPSTIVSQSTTASNVEVLTLFPDASLLNENNRSVCKGHGPMKPTEHKLSAKSRKEILRSLNQTHFSPGLCLEMLSMKITSIGDKDNSGKG